jgi:hypothetical protein
MIRTVILLGVLALGCNGPRLNQASLQIEERHGYDGEPRIAVLSCERSHELKAEMGRKSAMLWCEPVDGGAP